MPEETLGMCLTPGGHTDCRTYPCAPNGLSETTAVSISFDGCLHRKIRLTITPSCTAEQLLASPPNVPAFHPESACLQERMVASASSVMPHQGSDQTEIPTAT